MIERVAKALSVADGNHPDACSNDEDETPMWTLYVKDASAAIEALRPEFEKLSAAYGGSDGSVWIDDRTPIGLYVDSILNEIET